MVRRTKLPCVAFACLALAGCLTVEEKDPAKRREAVTDPRIRTRTERRHVVAPSDEKNPRSAIVFGRFYFYLDGFGGAKGDLRKGIKVRVTEHWPEGKTRHHTVTTDETGYFQLTGMSSKHGYNVTEAVFPRTKEKVPVEMLSRMRPEGRVLNLGEVICIVDADGGFQNKWKDFNIYNPNRPLIQHALTRNAGSNWEQLIRERHAYALKMRGY